MPISITSECMERRSGSGFRPERFCMQGYYWSMGMGLEAFGGQRQRRGPAEWPESPERAAAVRRGVEGYRANSNRLQSMGVLDVWYLHAYPGRDNPLVRLDPKSKAVFAKTVAKALRTDNRTLLPKVADHSAATESGVSETIRPFSLPFHHRSDQRESNRGAESLFA